MKKTVKKYYLWKNEHFAKMYKLGGAVFPERELTGEEAAWRILQGQDPLITEKKLK